MPRLRARSIAAVTLLLWVTACGGSDLPSTKSAADRLPAPCPPLRHVPKGDTAPTLSIESQHPGGVLHVSVSPDGLVASAGADGVRIWSLRDRGLLRTLPDLAASVQWSADGSELLVVPGAGPLYSLDRSGSRTLRSRTAGSHSSLTAEVNVGALGPARAEPSIEKSSAVAIDGLVPTAAGSSHPYLAWGEDGLWWLDERLERVAPHWFSGRGFLAACETPPVPSSDGSLVVCARNDVGSDDAEVATEAQSSTRIRAWRRYGGKAHTERVLDLSRRGETQALVFDPGAEHVLAVVDVSTPSEPAQQVLRIRLRDHHITELGTLYGDHSTAAVSPTGQHFAVSARLGGLAVWELPSNRMIWRTEAKGGGAGAFENHLRERGALAFTADGRQLAAAAGGRLLVYDVRTGRPQYSLGAPLVDAADVAFADDEHLLVVGTGPEDENLLHVVLWSLPGASIVRKTTVSLLDPRNDRGFTSWSLPDAHALQMWRPMSGRFTDEEGPCRKVEGLTRARLNLVAVAGQRHVEPLATAPVTCLLRGESIGSVDFAGNHVLVGGWVGHIQPRGAPRPFYNLGEPLAFRRHGERQGGPNQSSHVMTILRRLEVLDLATGRRVVLADADEYGPFSVDAFSFSSSGRWVALRNGTIWDSRDGRRIATLELQHPGNPSTGVSRLITFGLLGYEEVDGVLRAEPAVGVDFGSRRGISADVLFSDDDGLVALLHGGTFALYELPSAKHVATVRMESLGIDAAAFVAGGRDLVVADSERRLRRYRGGKLVAQSAPSATDISAIRSSPSGKVLATIGSDGAVRIWDLEGLRERGTLLGFSDDEHIAFTPTGAYAGTREVSDRIGWVFSGEERFGFEQFAASYHRPKAVRTRLTGASHGEVTRHPARPPRLTVAASSAATTHGDKGRVRVSASSQRQIHYVQAYVEGRPAGAPQRVCRPTADLEFEVPLTPGQNRVALVAFDDVGVASNVATVDLEGSGEARRRPDLWLVSVGISRYPGLPSKLQLGLADDDARGVATLLGAQGGPNGLFRKVRSVQLIDEQATNAAIRQALDGWAKMPPGDVGVLFLAGHGFKRRGSGDMVFATSGIRGQIVGGALRLDEASLSDHSVGWSGISDAIAAAPGRVLVLLDACHSGDVSQQLVVRNNALAAALVEEQRAGAVVFAAAKGRQQSYEPGGGRSLELVASSEKLVGSPSAPHGFFTGALLRSLRTPATDRNADGVVQLSELIDDVTARVHVATRGMQTPYVPRRELFGDFGIAAASGGRGHGSR